MHEGAGGEKGSALWLIGLCVPALGLTSPVLPWSAVNARHQPICRFAVSRVRPCIHRRCLRMEIFMEIFVTRFDAAHG